MDEPKTCPYYKGVCGLDESYVCFCSSTYLFCSVYIEAQEKDVEQSLTELKNRCCGRFDDGTRVFLISENEIDGIIESLKKQQPKWIPVDEKKPKSMANKVLVYLDHEDLVGYIGFGHYEKFQGEEMWYDLEHNEQFSKRGYTVTHWMPLPEPPKDDTH